MDSKEKYEELKALAATMLEIGVLLMVSGASSDRIRKTIGRITDALGYSIDMLISQRTLILTIQEEEHGHSFSSLKRTTAHGVNFTMLSGISTMSWLVVEEKWGVQQIREELERIKRLPPYPPLVTRALVGLAGASFCRLAGGDLIDMALVFLGTFIGLYVRHRATKMNFNPYICVFLAAFSSSFAVGLPFKLGVVHTHEHAFATSVLFLIPGVSLINSFSDIIDGNLLNGLIRGVNGFVISFCIALGLLTSMLLYGF